MKKQSAKTLAKRLASLMPGGVPRWVRIYKMEVEPSWDEYTVVFTGAAVAKACGGYPFIGMGNSGQLYHGFESTRPVDVNKWGFAPAVGRKNHLGRRLGFTDLNTECQKAVCEEYLDYHNLRPGFYYGEKLEEA